MRVGVDTGGTFTDLVAEDGRVAKVPSTPQDPGAAVREAVATVADDPPAVLAHGTTVATNALLERRGGVVALVTNAGFVDVVEVARQDRPSLYDQFADRPAPLVERDLRYEVRGRLGPDGGEVERLGSMPSIAAGVDTVAVCLLHADLNPAHEQELSRLLRDAGFDVCCSHEVSPEFREYERTVTTVVNAYLRGPCRAYLSKLIDVAREVLVMTSAAGLVRLDDAVELPARLLLSGPAGGVLAAAHVAQAAGFPDAVTLDMGGTSTDVCLVRGGVPEPAPQRVVGGFPVRQPSLDIHTIGAGGGSIAYLDPGGALAVGPESAGADPGPACYGRGGVRPTVTDADLVAGRIAPDAAFPGLGRLDLAAARAALDRAGLTAGGVIAVVDANMTQAIRAVTVERGVDPRGLALVAFGGAGPLHACALADALRMPAVVIPPRAGVLSAAGLLSAPRREDRVRSWPRPSDHSGISEALEALGKEAAAEFGGAAEVGLAVDCRYAGQSHEVTVPAVDAFEEEHRRRNGYARPGAAVEVVALRATARVTSPVALADLAAGGQRAPVRGPAVLTEPDCTVWLPAGWSATVHASGSWVLTR